ncbi:hypothetical protein [Engelhardtia mirabilis]|uniref:Uncharacterized protein n=1 Tax=Engelhardtia mirabilis TaxID=2528011 RepID=A0A518BIP1_9BACT|nr:hypothetical protein Pla133_19240 [Planctomycetes bacterium Pla133]QDV01174.1 hypothetical protein Pla86_19230 [Planctomycetes bacterium Pla86]
MQKLTPLAALFAGSMLAPAALAQAELVQALGNGGAIDVSLDGSVVVIGTNTWTESGGFVPVAGTNGLVAIDAAGVRLAGQVVDGLAFNNAGYWDGATWTALGSVSGNCDANKSSAYDISADGGTVVGLAWDGCTARAFYWTQPSGLVALTGAGSGSYRANCVDFFGSTVGGWDRINGSSNQPAVWTDLSMPPTIVGADGEVRAISADGTVFAGQESFQAAIMRIGQPAEYIPTPAGVAAGSSILYDCDAAGQVFVGQGGGAGPFAAPAAIYYRADVGSIALADLAEGLGATLPVGATMSVASAVSADGLTVVGGLQTFAPFPSDAFILRLPDAFLLRDTADISLSLGGTQNLDVLAGPDKAGDLYYVLGSASGSAPGVVVDGINIPLNLDSYFLFTLNNANTLIANSFGFLDATGKASASITLPAGSDASLAGLSVDHAYAVIDSTLFGVSAASNTQSLNLIP